MGYHDYGILSSKRVKTAGYCSYEVSKKENINNIYITYELCELYLVRDSQAPAGVRVVDVHGSKIIN